VKATERKRCERKERNEKDLNDGTVLEEKARKMKGGGKGGGRQTFEHKSPRISSM